MSRGSRLSRSRKLRSLPEGKVHTVAVERIDDGYRVETDRAGAGMSLVRGPGVHVFSVLSENGPSFEVTVERRESEIEVALGHRLFRFEPGAESKGIPHRAKSSGRFEVKSPMPGKVVKVLVSKGEAVAAGQAILLFEAMKMQNELRSPEDGIVAEIAVEAGQAVEARERLYVLDPPQN